MAGLNLSSGIYGGVSSVTAPQYGSNMSYNSGMGAANSQAFAGVATNPVSGSGSALSPANAFGLATWLGIGAVVALVALRNSLPN
jgi:hypothetical protein